MPFDPIYDRVSGIIPPIEWATMEDDVLRSLAPMFSDISSFLASQEVRL